MTHEPPRHVHSADYFGDSRDYWWNPDYLELLARRAGLSSVRRALDVGSGFGHWGRALLPVLPEGATVLGVEREPDSVAEAARRAERLGLSGRLSYRQGDAMALPVGSGEFDLVTCQTVLMHLADVPGALAEMKRALGPGGVLLCVEPSNLSGSVALEELWAAPDPAKVDPETVVSLFRFQLLCERGKRALGEGDNSLGERLPRLVQAAGFARVEVYLSDRASPVLPPYEQRHEKLSVSETRQYLDEGLWIWRKDETRRFFLAGGGGEAEFEPLWRAALDQRRRLVEQMGEGTYAVAGAQSGIIVIARKAG